MVLCAKVTYYLANMCARACFIAHITRVIHNRGIFMPHTKKEQHKHFCLCCSFELGYPDSNQKRQDQNLQCYHYTIPQCFLTPPPYPGKRLLNKFVGVPGLEPGKAGPESAVLPLHHTPIKHKKWSVPGSIALEYGCKSSTLLQTRQILRRFFSNNLSNGYPEQAVMSRCPKLVRYKMVPHFRQWAN